MKVVTTSLMALSFAHSSYAGDAEIKKAIESLYPTAKVDKITATGIKGVYEATVGQDVVYAEENGKFLMFGNLVDVTTKKNLTEVTKERLSRINFKDLPLELAIKTVKGNGSRVFATFEDPNCGYCKKLHNGLKTMNDYTLYTFLLPILSEDSKAKTKAIWCAPDKTAALGEWMTSNVVPVGPSCETPTTKVMEFANRMGIKGTPTIFFEDGTRAPGYISNFELEQKLNAAVEQRVSVNRGNKG